MFIRPCYRKKNGKRHAYWALVESYRTDRGPGQRVVAYLGQLKDTQRRGVKRAAEGKKRSPFQQPQLFDHDAKPEPEWIEVDTANARVENQLEFGGPRLAMELIRTLQSDKLLENAIPRGEEAVFIGRSFDCSPATLIPTEETALLVRVASQFIREKQKRSPSPIVIEIGTGIGVVMSGAVRPAEKTPTARGESLDMNTFSDDDPKRPICLLFIHHSCGGQWFASEGPNSVQTAAHEWIGMIWYWIKGRV